MFDNIFFGLLLTLVAYQVALKIHHKFKNPLLNPLLVSIFIIVIILKVCHISYDTYMIGASYLANLLVPATALLAIKIYEQRALLKQHGLIILIGTTLGALTSIFSTVLLVKLFNLDQLILDSIIAKNVTTAIAVGITERLDGLVPITIIVVIIAGMVGYVGLEFLSSIFKLKSDIAKGLACGSASHALGTTKALEVSTIAAAMSSLALTISGLITLVLLLFY